MRKLFLFMMVSLDGFFSLLKTSELQLLYRLNSRIIDNIECSDIIYGGGAIHCLTQQQPVV